MTMMPFGQYAVQWLTDNAYALTPGTHRAIGRPFTRTWCRSPRG